MGFDLFKPKGNQTPGGGNRRTPSKDDVMAMADTIAPFVLGGGAGILRVNPPRWWKRIDLYVRAMVMAAVGETARRRGLKTIAGACFALGAEYAAERVARQVQASKAAKAAGASTDDAGAEVPPEGRLPYSADDVIRREAMGQLPQSIGGSVGRAHHSFIDDVMFAA